MEKLVIFSAFLFAVASSSNFAGYGPRKLQNEASEASEARLLFTGSTAVVANSAVIRLVGFIIGSLLVILPIFATLALVFDSSGTVSSYINRAITVKEKKAKRKKKKRRKSYHHATSTTERYYNVDAANSSKFFHFRLETCTESWP